MDLLARFRENLQQTLHLRRSDGVVLAVSGGRDSMLMAHLFLKTDHDCHIAHCNFGLRGEDSDRDEAFVRDFARENNLAFSVEHFETEAFAKEKGISVQMAARELRYGWFEELRQAIGAERIAVAQHRDDHLETVLLNLTRGTGLQGLQGILPERGRIIRPLLFLTRAEIDRFVADNGIPFREDSSNLSAKYARNKIRLEIVPRFREIAPDFDEVFARNVRHFREGYELLQTFIASLRERIFAERGGVTEIRKEDLEPHLDSPTLLFELFKPYGFSEAVLGVLRESFRSEPGKTFMSRTHRLLLDRDLLYLRKTIAEGEEPPVEVHADTKSVVFGGRVFRIEVSEDRRLDGSSAVAKLDFDRLVFPLLFRFWQRGDVFRPLGMRGKKKLSDFFIDRKIPLFEKRKIPILVNGDGAVLWVAGHRIGEDGKITEKTKKVLTLACK